MFKTILIVALIGAVYSTGQRWSSLSEKNDQNQRKTHSQITNNDLPKFQSYEEAQFKGLVEAAKVVTLVKKDKIQNAALDVMDIKRRQPADHKSNTAMMKTWIKKLLNLEVKLTQEEQTKAQQTYDQLKQHIKPAVGSVLGFLMDHTLEDLKTYVDKLVSYEVMRAARGQKIKEAMKPYEGLVSVWQFDDAQASASKTSLNHYIVSYTALGDGTDGKPRGCFMVIVEQMELMGISPTEEQKTDLLNLLEMRAHERFDRELRPMFEKMVNRQLKPTQQSITEQNLNEPSFMYKREKIGSRRS